MKTTQFIRLAILAAAGFASTAFILPTTGYVQYGDGLSYSLPLLAYFYDHANGGGTGPGNPFYVSSTPGAI